MKTKQAISIVDAIKDANLFRSFLADKNDKLQTWVPWMTALRTLYGHRVPTDQRALITQCTGRSCAKLPPDGFQTALFLTGRRSGKSRIASVIGAYEACLAGHEKKLSPGERGVVPIIAPSMRQGRIIKDYLRGIFASSPFLEDAVDATRRDGFDLTNGTRIEICAGDFRTIRGYTLLAAIVDEAAFFGLDEESKVRSDTELIRAIIPALATTGGRLIGISSPYARKGWTWTTYQRYFGNDLGRTLVWNCPSRTMNATLPQSVVDEAMAEDMASAKSEWYGEFRDDISAFISRELVESLVIPGRTESLPVSGVRYSAFADLSGGRGDDAALAIAHQEGRKVVIDLAKVWKPPFAPNLVVQAMVDEMRQFNGLRNVTGDNYSAEFVASAFQSCGVNYLKCDKPKSGLYAELLPRLTSGEIELLDNKTLIDQLAGLERRVRSGGKDVIDHPPGGHDDLANAVAGVAAVKNRILIGALPRH